MSAKGFKIRMAMLKYTMCECIQMHVLSLPKIYSLPDKKISYANFRAGFYNHHIARQLIFVENLSKTLLSV